MARSPVVCVLGMHRSGTSVVARILNLLGIHLGPAQRLLKPGLENPKGFWEHQGFIKLNTLILERLGGSWHDPPAFSTDWAAAADLEDLRHSARELIREEFTDAEEWGWKDPRTCLTLPFWQQVLPSLRYLICLRHPLDVARSLERRNGFPVEKGVYLWLTYLRSALEHTVGQAPCLVVYEELMANWRPELCRLAQFLGKPELGEEASVQQAVQEFIDPNLQHHGSADLALGGMQQVDISQKALFVAEQIYARFRQERALSEEGQLLLDEVLQPIEGERARQKQAALAKWASQVKTAEDEIAAVVPAGESFILVDGDQWGTDPLVRGRHRIPFLEREGRYWGPPEDDDEAVRELERLRCDGASYLVVGWPAFWWLDCYSGFHRHVRLSFPCILQNDRVIVFSLQPRHAVPPLVTAPTGGQ